MGIESNIESPVAEAVRKVGSQSAFGRLCGKSQTSVYELLQDGRPLWAEAVLKVEAATGVSRHDLRPDLYPRDEPVPSGRTGGVGFASASAASFGERAPVSADENTSPSDDHQLQRNRGASPPAGHRPVQQMVGDKAS